MGMRDWISWFSDMLRKNMTNLGSIGDDAVYKLLQQFCTEQGGVLLYNILTRCINKDREENLRELIMELADREENLIELIMELEARVRQLEKEAMYDRRLPEEAEQVQHCAVAFPSASPNVEVCSSGEEIEGNLTEEGRELKVSMYVSLHSHASSVPLFDGLNFSDWWEQIQFHLGVLDLDLALKVEKPTAHTDESSDDEKTSHKAWERSNRLSLMFMRMTVADNLKSTLTSTKGAKEFKKLVEKKSQTADTLMSTLTTMKYDGSCTMHEHVLVMTTLAAELKNLGINVDENPLVQFILNSLPSEQYGPFQMNYNAIKDKRNINELTSMLVQEETRLKNQRTHYVHLLSHQEAKKNSEKKGRKSEKKEHGSVECHFCHEVGHLKKYCLKRKAWFEKKGIPYDPNHKFK